MTNHEKLRGCLMKTKRLFDVLLAAFGLTLFSPLLLLICILIFLEDFNSVFFIQKRAGFQKRPFEIIKFRTMNSEVITNIGKWLRATGLDEIPQFINVLKGDMSIVGPRPLTEEDIWRLGWDCRTHEGRWSLKPGITGLSQLFGGQNAEASWRYDQRYLKRRSLLMDMRIIFLSFCVNIIGKKNVRKLVGKIYPNEEAA